MIEFYKYICGVLVSIKKNVFPKRVLKCNIRSCRVTLLRNPRAKRYSFATVPYKATQIWSMLPARYKSLSSLGLFNFEIKHWHCSDYPYNIYRIFTDGVGSSKWN